MTLFSRKTRILIATLCLCAAAALAQEKPKVALYIANESLKPDEKSFLTNKLLYVGGKPRDGNGTDDYGFSALPGSLHWKGYDDKDSQNSGYWWTATASEKDDSFAYKREMWHEKDAAGEGYTTPKGYGFSVRCIKDN